MRNLLSFLILKFLLGIISLYQCLLSPLLPPSCRYIPSCSEYTREALKRHGILKGLYLGISRVLRCHPWGDYGHDPVPDPRSSEPRPPSDSHSLLLLPLAGLLFCSLLGFYSCSSVPKTTSTKNVSYENMDQSYHRKLLKKQFKRLKGAIVKGDLKTIQDLFVLQGNEEISLEALQKTYEQVGDAWISQYKSAHLATKAGQPITFFKPEMTNLARARIEANMKIRFSQGNPGMLTAVYIDDQWKFFHSPQRLSPNSPK